MNKRYIELYSANRNRQQYPQAASFIVPFGSPQHTSPYLDINTNKWISPSQDPITSGSIFYNWQGPQGQIAPAVVNPPIIACFGNFKNTTTDSNILLGPVGFPATGLSSINNYYLGYYLNDTVAGQSRIITNYTPNSATVNVNLAFHGIGTDLYSISDPSNGTAIVIPAASGIYVDTPPLQIHIPAVDNSGKNILTYAQAYNGYYIVDETMTAANGGQLVYAKITSYDNTTNLASIDRAFSPGVWSVSDVYTLRQTLPYSQTSIVAATSNTITLPIPATPFVGQYIYVTNFTTAGVFTIPTPTWADQIYFVESATGNIASVRNINGISPAPAPANQVVNIVSFARENYIPLLYSGGMVSQSESVCYEVSLIDLSLPNVILSTGSRIAFYPFVYVQLSNISSSTASSNNIIYSNNPNSSNALFICTVTDISQPINSSFLKIDAGSQTQTIKFKPNDTLKFSVFLPDGRLFQTFDPDNYSPYPPNLSLQIDAVFGVRRL
jgi:hypothetical protein